MQREDQAVNLEGDLLLVRVVIQMAAAFGLHHGAVYRLQPGFDSVRPVLFCMKSCQMCVGNWCLEADF